LRRFSIRKTFEVNEGDRTTKCNFLSSGAIKQCVLNRSNKKIYRSSVKIKWNKRNSLLYSTIDQRKHHRIVRLINVKNYKKRNRRIYETKWFTIEPLININIQSVVHRFKGNLKQHFPAKIIDLILSTFEKNSHGSEVIKIKTNETKS